MHQPYRYTGVRFYPSFLCIISILRCQWASVSTFLKTFVAGGRAYGVILCSPRRSGRRRVKVSDGQETRSRVPLTGAVQSVHHPLTGSTRSDDWVSSENLSPNRTMLNTRYLWPGSTQSEIVRLPSQCLKVHRREILHPFFLA